MTGSILLVIGAVALFAAIVGGGIKFRDIEVGDVKSLWRQWLLGAFGLVVSLIGLGLVTGILDLGNSTETSQNVESADQGGNSGAPEAASGDQNAADTAATDANSTEAAPENNSSEEPAQQN